MTENMVDNVPTPPLAALPDQPRVSSNGVRLLKCTEGHDGSSVLILFPPTALSDFDGQSIVSTLGEEFSSYVLTSGLPSVERVLPFIEELERLFAASKIKRATVLGFGGGATLCQALAVANPKFVRRAVLVDPQARVQPSFLQRCIDQIENRLPLGLPFGKLGSEYDSRPELHRVRCPVLILSSPGAQHFALRQARLLARRIPNAWRVLLQEPPVSPAHLLSSEVSGLIREFLQVPTKRPQKGP